MATLSRDDIFNPDLYLSQDQQNLLVAALASNNSVPRSASNLYKSPNSFVQGNRAPSRTQVGLPHQFRVAPAVSHLQGPTVQPQIQPETISPLEEIGLDGSPPLDFGLDWSFDDGYNYDDNKDGDQLATGGSQTEHGATERDGDIHDKRKNPDDIKSEDDGGGKRREGDDKTAKKPGRKPLTSEPTSKRKAQNRAAQRAFRERKEKHLKDLEVKVADLEKASESANHENGLLRAQVSRLQDELKEYRKRLSGLRRPPAQSPPGHSSLISRGSDGLDNSNTFQFDFPKFGGLPGSRLFDNSPLSKSDKDDNQAAPSVSKMDEARDNSPDNNGAAGLFGRSTSTNVGGTASTPGYSHSPDTEERHNSMGNVPVPQLNGGAISCSASPSASTVSHHGPGSSACTSPETYNNHSPVNGQPMNTPFNSINEEFGNQDLRGGALYGQSASSLSKEKESANVAGGIDWLVQQNRGRFDPVLFGDYREPQDAIISADYGFFNDAFPTYDFSPFDNKPSMMQQPAKGVIEQADEKQDAEVEPVPSMNTANRVEVDCNKLWDRIQSNESYKNGELDIDSLCNDLQKKAKCSETGIVFDQKLVDAVLAKFAKDPGTNPLPSKYTK